MMKALEEWSLDELIGRVIEERLVDNCFRRTDHVVIVQGTTRFVLDPRRAHAFLRGILKGMSTEYRRAMGPASSSQHPWEGGEDEQGGLFDTFRRHLVKKWWGRYVVAGCPCGQSIRGLMIWIRYNTQATVN